MLDLRGVSLAAGLAALALGGCHHGPEAAQGGEQAVVRGACGSCHLIPGVPLADGMAGPSLANLGRRAMIGGVLPNTPANLALWMRDPQRFAPGGAMPPTPMSEVEAREAAAYLETLGTAP